MLCLPALAFLMRRPRALGRTTLLGACLFGACWDGPATVNEHPATGGMSLSPATAVATGGASATSSGAGSPSRAVPASGGVAGSSGASAPAQATPIGIAGAPASALPAGAAGAAANAAGAGGRGASDEGPIADQGKGDGSDVITIGDSWMLLVDGLGIEVSLERVAMNDYRNYGVPGTRIDEIVQQYADAKKESPKIATVVMTAGGNDILQDPAALLDCPALGMTCKKIIEGVWAKVERLWEDMAKDGVKDVVIIEYARPQVDLLQLQPPLDYSTELTQMGCTMAPLRCTLIDASKLFAGHEYIGLDNIHPTEEGYDLLGKATYDAMVKTGARR